MLAVGLINKGSMIQLSTFTRNIFIFILDHFLIDTLSVRESESV